LNTSHEKLERSPIDKACAWGPKPSTVIYLLINVSPNVENSIRIEEFRGREFHMYDLICYYYFLFGIFLVQFTEINGLPTMVFMFFLIFEIINAID
jgi:hypothetical protein